MTRTGRPPDAGLPRSHRIEVRVTEAEKGELLAALGDDDTLSDLLRNAGLKAARSQR